VDGELPQVSFRLSDMCLIGLLELIKSIKLPAAPEVTFDEIQKFRVSLVICLTKTLASRCENASNIYATVSFYPAAWNAVAV